MIDKLDNYIVNNNIKSVYEYDELTLQDLLSKFFNDIIECNKISKESLEFLIWLKNEGLATEVKKELELMYQDGRLTDIINELSGNLNLKIEEVKNYFGELINLINGDITSIDESLILVNNKLSELTNLVNENKNNINLNKNQIQANNNKFSLTTDNEELAKDDNGYNHLNFNLVSTIKKPLTNDLNILNEEFFQSETLGNPTFTRVETDGQYSTGDFNFDINEFGLWLSNSITGQCERGFKSNIKLKTSNVKLSCEFFEFTPNCSSVRVGLINDSNNFIMFNIDYINGIIKYELLEKANGVLKTNTLSPSRDISKWFDVERMRDKKQINMYIFNNICVLTVSYQNREILIGEHKLEKFDLTNKATLESLQPSFGARLKKDDDETYSKMTITKVNFSYTGGLNCGADYKVITYEDNKPIMRDNKIYLTSTTHMTTDISGNGVNVYEFDTRNYNLTLVGKIAFKINNTIIKNMGSCKVMYDRRIKQFIVVATDFNVNPVISYYALSKLNLLSGVNILVGNVLNIPYYNVGTWDLDLIYNNNRYEIIYTINNTPRKLIKAYSTDLNQWTLLKEYTSTVGSEGSVISKVGGRLVFTHLSTKGYLDLFDYETMTELKKIPMNYNPSNDLTPQTPMPWGSLISLSYNNISKYMLVMFDMEDIFKRVYGYGNMLVYETDYEFNGKDYKQVEQKYFN